MRFSPTRAELAAARESALLTRQIAESGSWRDGERMLADRLKADPADDEARFGLGMVRFIAAVEAFGQHHYRFGLTTPAAGSALPFLRMPVPLNPNPDILTYDLQRAALRRFLEDLAAVEQTLANIKDPDLQIVIDLEKTRLDFRSTGKPDANATLMAVVRSVSQPWTAPRAAVKPAAFEVAFDLGDAIWLRGYCHLLSAGLEFLLAYDWHDTFASAGGLFYPRIGAPGSTPPLPWTTGNGEIPAAVATIHQIRWEPTEPTRLAKVRDHLKHLVALSRDSWKAILSETDDDREWIPAPGQKNGVLPAMAVTKERLDTWLLALDEFDAVLDGRKLVPHWALDKGINLKRVLEEPRTFDLVLWVTGHAAAPYLEDGPVIRSETWRLWQDVFAGNFLGFAAYFN